MALTAGALSIVQVQQTKVKLATTEASGGTGPYSQQWHRSTDPAFVPGGGNALAGKTTLEIEDSGLIPGTQYYYKVVFTDGGASATINSAALAVLSLVVQPSQNQFAQSGIVGMIDQRFDYNTTPCEIDQSEAGVLYAGQAVKIVDSAGGVPKVVACSADADDVFGFINYDQKSPAFVKGMAVELSQAGNVIYLMATAAIARGAQVQSEVTTIGGVAPLADSSGADLVGYAFDKASAPGQIIRVKLSAPSFLKA